MNQAKWIIHRINHRIYRAAAVLLVCILALSIATPSRAADNSLSQLLGQVPDTPAAHTVVWYGSQSALEQALGIAVNNVQDVNKLSVQQRGIYLKAFGGQLYYSPFLGLESSDWRATFGFDSFQVDRELTVGVSPDWLNIMQGQFDTSAINGALTTLGYQTAQTEKGTLFAFNGSGGPDIAQASYRNLLVTGTQITAAPNAQSIAGVVAAAAGKVPSLASNAAYQSAAAALESGDILLVSAVLLDGSYVQQSLLNGAQGALPRFTLAALGYQRSQSAQLWTVALTYADKASADAAAAALPGLLGAYQSQSPQQAGRALFNGWKLAGAQIFASQDGKVFTVFVKLQPPANNDLGLATLIQDRDIGFLASR
jgi:hypothetical protein